MPDEDVLTKLIIKLKSLKVLTREILKDVPKRLTSLENTNQRKHERKKNQERPC